MSNSTLETRMAGLESQLSFQEEHVQQLCDVIARQDRALMRMEKELHRLDQLVRSLAGRMGDEGGHGDPEVPPHY
jgi:uncharacterized coiled-coil protein SlyX